MENAPEGRRGDRSVNGYAEDMQLFSGPLPLLPPAFDLPPQVIPHIWMCAVFLELAIGSSAFVKLLRHPIPIEISAPDMGSAWTRVAKLIAEQNCK